MLYGFVQNHTTNYSVVLHNWAYPINDQEPMKEITVCNQTIFP